MTRLPFLSCLVWFAAATPSDYPGMRLRGDFLSQRANNISRRTAETPPQYRVTYRDLYLSEACGGAATRVQRSHYLSLRDQKASMAIQSHRDNVLPRSVSKCRILIQTESHARLTVAFVTLDTVEPPFVCYMYLKLFLTDKPDLVCGKKASGRSVSSATSSLSLEWVINNGGEKPGRIHMVVTSYKDSDLSGNCESGMYACSNRHCVWSGFVCDGINNCGDGSDERLCIGGRQDHMLILAIVVLVSLFAVGTAIVFQIIYNRYSGRDIQTQYVVGPNVSQVGVVQVPK